MCAYRILDIWNQPDQIRSDVHTFDAVKLLKTYNEG